MYPANLIAYRLAKGAGGPGGPKVKRGAEILEGPYPKSFTDFIGQEKARMQLLAAITSSAKRNEPMSHALLASGTPGIGKTTLGRLTASVLQTGFVELGGLVTDKDAVMALKAMKDGDVLFLDEVHRLVSRGKAKAEWLLTLLQDGTIHTPTGVVQAPRITVIAATTDAQKLPETILDRFPIKPVLDPYSDDEATKIALLTAERLGFGDVVPLPADTGWLTGVAKACDNNPRRMGDLLESVRDVALSTDCANLLPNGYSLDIALDWNGLTPDGLTTTAQHYLLGLFGYGGRAGLPSIKALLNEEQVGHTEKLLIQKGLIQVTPQGRELTPIGIDRALELAAEKLEVTA